MSTRKAWELKLGDTTAFPTYQELDNFLASRARAFEVLSTTTKSRSATTRTVQAHAATEASPICPLCRTPHLMIRCSEFLAKSPSDRFAYIKAQKRCINCLTSSHTVKDCPKKATCKTCSKRHHTMLHFQNDASAVPTATPTNPANVAPASSKVSNPSPETTSSHLVSQTMSSKVSILLATAWVSVGSLQGRRVTVRALLDQGSITTFITENLAQRLRLQKSRASVSIRGVGDASTTSQYAATITIAPTTDFEPSFTTTALIMKTLTRYLPDRQANALKSCAHLTNLSLADPHPMSDHPIDIIIGADLYGFLLLDGRRVGSATEPVAQHTIFGWILSGPASPRSATATAHISVLHCTTLADLDRDIRRFWEAEDLPQKSHLSPDEAQCEDHFVATHRRDSTGRYIVRLPFKQTPPLTIGQSESIATKMLERSEWRLNKTPTHREAYDQFLAEYLSLGHMRRVPASVPASSQCVYIPHHAVIRETSATTRLRVVFNASSRTSNGTALNDHLHIGPKLQTDLSAVILRWRQYQYVLTADIAKMYRQIGVDSRDVDYQRILWRPPPFTSVEAFQLLTVTYGTAPAPYLALRVLQQLIKDEGSRFPLAVPVLRHNVYVDDCVFGAHTVVSARETRDQLIALLATAQFHLRKWASNAPELLSDLAEENHGLALSKSLNADDNVKVLGVTWNPDSDSFQFRVNLAAPPSFTKRTLLSTIARLFDPLGWVTPVIVVAKILMQTLWSLKVDWDTPLPDAIQAPWREHYQQLSQLHQLRIPRWTHGAPDNHSYELHGFADASSVAYAAVVYLRVQTASGQIVVSLVAAKSKVAPVKPLTIPRLELSAALLLCRLMLFVVGALNMPSSRCQCWTDSTIVLYWLSQPPSRWKTFVANRVAEIQTQLPTSSWRHVPTSENPADCASRGLSPTQLLSHDLWWSGPQWLSATSDSWPKDITKRVASPPEERTSVALHSTLQHGSWDLAKRFSSWGKLLRVTAYVRRFATHTRPTKMENPPLRFQATSLALTPDEIRSSQTFWIQYVQRECFFEELRCLQAHRPIKKRSSLLSLSPYLDEQNILRVRGRLQNAVLPDQAKHPIILKSHPLVTLIINNAHVQALHAGLQLTSVLLRREFWILRSRPTIRAVLYKCVTCARERAATSSQFMGNLPSVRVTRTARAFVHCGVDYAGPILIRTSPGRGHKSHKAYVALFICMVVKAIHLELVTDYSTAAFLAALKRFCSRRGYPSTMYSDNGTTFQGADKELTQAFRSATQNFSVRNVLATDRVEWKFIPPSAPHFGGLWEVGVKSVKYHLKRVVGAHTLTYEELSTMLCQIEACVNSRPLAPLSETPDDYAPLTPGHFLVGTALTALPEPSILDLKESRLSRWQLVQQMTESFWQRWSQDYIQGLQQRGKWRCLGPKITSGQLVLLRNPNLPPTKWELARITACHPGDDGIVRVVTVKTASSEYKRPLVKLCPLPADLHQTDRSETVPSSTSP